MAFLFHYMSRGGGAVSLPKRRLIVSKRDKVETHWRVVFPPGVRTRLSRHKPNAEDLQIQSTRSRPL